MANTAAPFGLTPIRHMYGGEVRLEAFTIASEYATAIYRGDPVKTTGTGRNIAIGTAGGVITGIFAGCRYTDAQGEYQFRDYWPAGQTLRAGTTCEALVWSDPNILFRGQASGSIVEADIGLLADLASGTGDPATGLSGWTVGAHDGSEAQLKIVGLSNAPLDNVYGNYATVDVLILEHEYRGAGTEV